MNESSGVSTVLTGIYGTGPTDIRVIGNGGVILKK